MHHEATIKMISYDRKLTLQHEEHKRYYLSCHLCRPIICPLTFYYSQGENVDYINVRETK